MLLAGGIAESFTYLPGNPGDWAVDFDQSVASLLGVCQPFDPARKVQINFNNLTGGQCQAIELKAEDLFGEDATLVHNLAPEHSEEWKRERIRAVVEKVNNPVFWNAMRVVAEHIEKAPAIPRADPAHQQTVQELETLLQGTVKSYMTVGVDDLALLRELVIKLVSG